MWSLVADFNIKRGGKGELATEPMGQSGAPVEVSGSSKVTTDNDRRLRSLRVVRILAVISIILLSLQFLLGMWANLFAIFPSPSPPINPMDQIFTEGPVLLALHVVVGVLLGIFSIAGLAVSIHARDRRLIILEVAALTSILFAGESGIEFVLSGYQDNLFSYAMAIGFIPVFLVYSWTELEKGQNDRRQKN